MRCDVDTPLSVLANATGAAMLDPGLTRVETRGVYCRVTCHSPHVAEEFFDTLSCTLDLCNGIDEEGEIVE